MEQQDNNTLMSILSAAGSVVMSILAAVWTVSRLVVTGRGSIMNDMEMKIENAQLKEELARNKSIKDMKDEIITEIKKSVNGGGK